MCPSQMQIDELDGKVQSKETEVREREEVLAKVRSELTARTQEASALRQQLAEAVRSQQLQAQHVAQVEEKLGSLLFFLEFLFASFH